MGKILVFSVILVFCHGISVVSTTKKKRNDDLLHEAEIKDYISLNVVNKEFHSSGSDLEAARSDECKCKNGKCMRACDIEKTIPCLDRRKVCTCIPGYAEKDGECVECNCGEGINCTFNLYASGTWKKTCLCPEGYRLSYTSDYYNYCIPECSNERPCQNGGTCLYKMCHCPWDIRGPLCEEIRLCKTMCEDRLELNCLYHQSKQIAYCTCKNSSLFYDPEANICKPCSCGNGYCEYYFTYFSQILKCNCYSGYKEFNGYCKQCSCGYGGQCELDSKGKKICHCEKGFFEREGHCLSCDCMSYGDTNTKCEVINNVKRCLCKEGYQDIFGQCEDIDECERDNPCHPSTTCHNTDGSFECRCPDGYKGLSGSTVEPGEVCNDINECMKSPDPCWLYNNVQCVNLPGSYKCECDIGYEPNHKYMEPHKTSCVKTTKSWGPALIVFFTSSALIILSILMHMHVKKRAARSNLRDH